MEKEFYSGPRERVFSDVDTFRRFMERFDEVDMLAILYDNDNNPCGEVYHMNPEGAAVRYSFRSSNAARVAIFGTVINNDRAARRLEEGMKHLDAEEEKIRKAEESVANMRAYLKGLRFPVEA